jgi:nucleoside 2-deoxyribosyltransferase
LFTAKEREEMQDLANCFEKAGFRTFLPQRDGLELAPCTEALVGRGLDPAAAASLVARAIFALDVYQVLEACDGIVANLNGRVPDEGAVSEAAIAWSSGKPVVGYKADTRSVFMGQDNPLVAGLFDFRIYDNMQATADAMKRALSSASSPEQRHASRRKRLSEHLKLGERIWTAMQAEDKLDSVARVICDATGASGKPPLYPAGGTAR